MKMQYVGLSEARINYMQFDPMMQAVENQDIVLVHGLATNVSFWYLGIAKALSYFGRVTVFDLRGHGLSDMPATGYSAESMAEDLRGVLNHLEIEEAHLIGHSYGGLVAAAFAAAHPDYVKSLILADVRLPSVQPQLSLKAWPLANSIAKYLESAGVDIHPDEPEFGLELLTRMAKLRAEGSPDASKMEKLLGGAHRSMGQRAAKQWLKLMETTSARRDFSYGSAIKPADLATAKCSIYGLYGEHSMTRRSGEALAEALPDCRFEVMPRAGHFFPSSRPREFTFRAMSFLAEEMNMAPLAIAASARAMAGRELVH